MNLLGTVVDTHKWQYSDAKTAFSEMNEIHFNLIKQTRNYLPVTKDLIQLTFS